LNRKNVALDDAARLARAGSGWVPWSSAREAIRRTPAAVITFLRILSLAAISIAVLIWRRPDQMQQPTLWFEEATQLLKSYADCGACAIWRPVNGNFLLIPKLILLPAFKISIFHTPQIATTAAFITICLVVISIAQSPTHLRARYLCALSTLFVPCWPEAYGIALYTAWWAGLLAILALLWDAAGGHFKLRHAFLILAGLSSPIIILMSPLFVARAFFERSRREKIIATTACFLAVANVVAVILTPTVMFPASGAPEPVHSFNWVILSISKFFGMFVGSDGSGSFVAGCLLLLLLGCFADIAKSRIDRYFVLLCLSLIFSIVSAILRASIEVINPYGGGSRYFFYPFILLSFSLVWLAVIMKPSTVRFAPLVILLGAVLMGVRHPGFVAPMLGSRPWHETIEECAGSSGVYELHVAIVKIVPMTGSSCRALIDESLFA
jgi:hypothetical protein